MKRFLAEIKGARRIEWFLLIAAAAALLLVSFGETDESSKLRTEHEKRLISVLSGIEGAGHVDAMISEANEHTGVLIIAEGAEDLRVYLNLQRAAKTLLDVELADIEIIPLGE